MKRNKPMIALAALLCALLFCPLFAAKADAAGEVNADEYVYDLYENLGRTPMLSASEKQEIAEAMASAVTHRAEGDCRFVFFIYPYEYRNDYLTSTDLYTFSDLVDKPKNVMVLEVTVMPKGYGDRYKFMAHIFGENERVSDTEIEYLEDLIRDDVKAGRFA